MSPSDVPEGTKYVGLEHVGSDGSVFAANREEVGQLRSSKFLFTREHLLYGKLRPYLSKIARPGFDGVCSTDILPILPGGKVDAGFLYHYLRTDGLVRLASRRAAGANLPRLNPAELLSFKIPLPPIEEQRRIAAVLDAADALRAKRREAIAKLDSLTQAIFIDMFGDPVTNPKGWPMGSLEQLGTLDRGISKHRPRNAPELLGGSWPLIQTGDVANSGGYITASGATYSDLGLAQSRLWQPGTLCITIAANIAKTGILSFEACFPDSVVGFVANRPASTEFVRALLSFLQPLLEARAPESAQKNINLKVLRELVIPIPPNRAVEHFAEAVGAANSLAAQHVNAAAKLDTLFASLQQRAFRGEL